jgi:putative glutamine amidotransferase
MLEFNPSWSLLFDACICVALFWLVHTLARHRPLFRSIGAPVMYIVAALISLPVLYFGKVLSLLASLAIVPWLAIEAYNDTEQPLPRRFKALLATTRILVFVLVIVCLLRPRLVFEEAVAQRPAAVILADVSSSMANKDCPPQATRYQALRQIIEDNAAAIEDIREKYDCRFGVFASTFTRVDDLPPQPVGKRTRIAEVFGKVAEDLRGAKTAGIVMLSDGRNTGLGDPIAAAKRLGAPVFTVCLGASKGSADFSDSSVQNVDCPERVFVGNRATASIRIAYDGIELNRNVKISMHVYNKGDTQPDPEASRSKAVKLPGPGRTIDEEFEYTPTTVGIKRIVVSVEEVANDANAQNNSREIFVRASESALQVRLIEGEVRWEYKFLRRAIAGAENIKLVAINAFLAAESDNAMFLPKDDAGWGEVALIVLGDISADRFTPQQLERIRKFVEDGGALLMLGGFNTLGPGGYGSTAIAKALPVDVKKANVQKLDALQIAPTPKGLEHNILAFGPKDETRKIWKSLPPVSGYTAVSSVKPAAEVLVKTPGGDPVLVVQRYGKGRTAVFAADTTWRWIFNKGKFARYHKAFWRQLVQWLTKSGYGGVGGGVWCETDRLRYLTGDTPILTVRATGAKVERARIAAVITGPGLKLHMPIGEGAGQYVLGLPKPLEKSGEYTVTVTATPPDDVKLKDMKNMTAESRFVAQEIDVESETPGADKKLLEDIAKATGGQFFSREEAGRAFNKVIEQEDTGSKVTKKRYRRLWDNAYMYFALAALLCTEWIARKRKGLA